jgi:hypothetical protein
MADIIEATYYSDIVPILNKLDHMVHRPIITPALRKFRCNTSFLISCYEITKYLAYDRDNELGPEGATAKIRITAIAGKKYMCDGPLFGKRNTTEPRDTLYPPQ